MLSLRANPLTKLFVTKIVIVFQANGHCFLSVNILAFDILGEFVRGVVATFPREARWMPFAVVSCVRLRVCGKWEKNVRF